jgi:hypothetical protein
MNPKDKALLKKLIKEKATRNYFIEKMRIRLSKDWQAKRTNTTMHKETKKRYEIFQDKIDAIDNNILKLIPPNTHFNELRFTITD